MVADQHICCFPFQRLQLRIQSSYTQIMRVQRLSYIRHLCTVERMKIRSHLRGSCLCDGKSGSDEDPGENGSEWWQPQMLEERKSVESVWTTSASEFRGIRFGGLAVSQRHPKPLEQSDMQPGAHINNGMVRNGNEVGRWSEIASWRCSHHRQILGEFVKMVHKQWYTSSSYQLRDGPSWLDYLLHKKIGGLLLSGCWNCRILHDQLPTCRSHTAQRRGAGCRVQSAVHCVCSLQSAAPFFRAMWNAKWREQEDKDSVLVCWTCWFSFQSDCSRCSLPSPFGLDWSFVSSSLPGPIRRWSEWVLQIVPSLLQSTCHSGLHRVWYEYAKELP